MRALLLLEDGTYLEGQGFGAEGISSGELVFNTAMTGYQEMLTDPSYCGQVLMLTYPMIGNYGTNETDIESKRVHLSGLVVSEYVEAYSNFRASQSLDAYLKQSNTVGIHQVDTRYLTRKVREKGSMKMALAHGDYSKPELEKKLGELPSMKGLNLVEKVASRETYSWDEGQGGPKHVVVIDCGVKYNILRSLRHQGLKVTVVPPSIDFGELMSLKPDGLLVSNGPGDPEVVPQVPQLLERCMGQFPILGICLGHQLLGIGLGAKTYKLGFGHHGANHPVQNRLNQGIEVTSQNHGFAIESESLLSKGQSKYKDLEITHVHLNDETVEGFRIPSISLQSIQYHPEASPGPHDAMYIFKEFAECIKTFSTK